MLDSRKRKLEKGDSDSDSTPVFIFKKPIWPFASTSTSSDRFGGPTSSSGVNSALADELLGSKHSSSLESTVASTKSKSVPSLSESRKAEDASLYDENEKPPEVRRRYCGDVR